ncbi:MAG: hypothetical protein KIT72_16060 [Polyangiaceae bacterium]|nr:hypothetical protein [Polyangiaceae bacterium]MCW5791932.1 hypothetical protein [Polyangiaceae bacterium]
MRTATWLTAACLTALGCAASPGVTSEAPPPSPPATSSAPPAASIDPPPAKEPELPKLSLEPLEPRHAEDAALNLELKFPIRGQRVRLDRAAAYNVRLQLDGLPRGTKGRALLQLDDHQPIEVDPSKPVRLGSLIDEDRDLTAGPHLLFAVALGPDGRALSPRPGASRGPEAWVEFGVDTAELPERPAVIRVVSPRGTFNGPAQAEAAELDVRVGPPLSQGPARRVRLVIRGPAVLSQDIDAGPHRLLGLVSGDYHITATLLDARSEPLTHPGATDEQIITVNLDAPSAESR